jgi:hypothetical protein
MRWIKLDLTSIYYQKKIKLTHPCFKSSPSIYSSWMDHVNFLHFWPSKVRVSPTSVVSSLSPPEYRISSDRRHHAAALCHTSFPLSQDELAASALSFSNASSCRLPSEELPKMKSTYVQTHVRNPITIVDAIENHWASQYWDMAWRSRQEPIATMKAKRKSGMSSFLPYCDVLVGVKATKMSHKLKLNKTGTQ